MNKPAAEDHLWVSVAGDDGTTWLFDATFLLSDYRCIYGAGCPSIGSEPDPAEVLGCCVHGAHMVDGTDRKAVLKAASRLETEQWQFKALAEGKGGPLKRTKKGDWVTRKTKGACIFLNRDGFEAGSGCALHLAAEAAGERPMDWKPDVCWQVPIRLDVHEDDYGHETIMVRAWERRDWGPGGEDFHWWCIDSAETYRADDPVYRSSYHELVEMTGQAVYDRLVAALEQLVVAERPGHAPVQVSIGDRPDSARR